jgi:hypothetical protein
LTRRSLSVCVRAVLLLFGALAFGALAAVVGSFLHMNRAYAAGAPSTCSATAPTDTINLGDGTTTLVESAGNLSLTSTNNTTAQSCGPLAGISTIAFTVISGATPTNLVLDQTGGVFPCTVVLQGPLNTGSATTEVDVTGASSESIAIGSNGINLNYLNTSSSTCTGYSAGTMTGVGKYVITAGSGALTLSAGGQGGTGAPVSVATTLDGQTGSADTFVAGDSNETFKTDTAGAVLDYSQVTCSASPCALPINESNTTLSQFNSPTGLLTNKALLSFNGGSGSFLYDLTTGKTDFNTVLGNSSVPTTYFVNNTPSVNLLGNVVEQGVGSGTFAITATGLGNQVVAGSQNETFGGDPNAHPTGTPVSGSNMTFTGGPSGTSDTFFVSGGSNKFVAGAGGDAFYDDGTNNTVDFSNAPATAAKPLAVDLATGSASAPAGPASYTFQRSTITNDLSPFVHVTGASGGNTAFTAGSSFSGFSIIGQSTNNTATFSPAGSGIIANLSETPQTPTTTTIAPGEVISGFAVQPGQVLFCTLFSSGSCASASVDTLTDITSVTGPATGFSTFYGGPSGTSDAFTAHGNNNTFLGDATSGACVSVCSYTVNYDTSSGNRVVAGSGTETFIINGSNLTAVGGTGTDTFNVTGSNNKFQAGSASDSFYDNGSNNTVDLSAVATSQSAPLFVDVNAGALTVGSPSFSLSSGKAQGNGNTYIFQRSSGSNDSSPFTTIDGSNPSGNTLFFLGDTGGLTINAQGTGNTITFEGSTFGVVANLSGSTQSSNAAIASGTTLTNFSIPSGSVLVTNPNAASCALATNNPCDSISGITNVTGPSVGFSTFYGDASATPASDTFTANGNSNTFFAGAGPETFNAASGATGNTVDFTSVPLNTASGCTPCTLVVNVSAGSASLMAGPTAVVTYGFGSGSFSRFIGFANGSTTFIAGSSALTYVGQGTPTSSNQDNVLTFAQVPLTSLTNLTVCVAGSNFGGISCSAGQALLGTTGNTIANFSDIQSFVGLSGATPSSSTTTFVIDDSRGALIFTGAGGTTTADFSPAARSVTVDLSELSNNVTVTLPTLLPAFDTISNITHVFGSAGGGNTFVVGTASSESFGDNGGTGDTLNFTHVNAGNGAVLTVNVSGVGTSDVATLQGSSVSYSFSSSVTNFIGSSGGFTTFLAGSTAGLSFTGAPGTTNNAVSFAADSGPVVVNLSSSPFGAVGPGKALLGPGSCPTNCDTLTNIPTVTGSASGGDTFVAGSGNETFLAGGGTGQETIDFSNLLGSVVVNVSSPGQVPSGTAFGKATSGGFTYDFTNFDGSAITFDGSTGGTTFFAGALGDTFSGNPLATNTLNFSDAPATSVTVYACVSGSGCVNPGQAVLGSGTRINFSNIESFVGLPGVSPASSTTSFVVDDSQAGLTFTGAGGTTTADFSPAARPVTVDLSQNIVGVTVLIPIGFPPVFVPIPAFDTISNITHVFGSAGGGNTFVVGTASSESFGDNGGTGDTLNFTHVNAGNGAVLTVNVSGVGTSDVATLQGSSVSYSFSSSVTNFIGSSGGFTTFLAGSTAGLSFTGAPGTTNNAVSFAADSGPVVVNLSSSPFGAVGPGKALLGPGSCPTNCDTLTNIPTVTGSASGGDTFVAGSGNETFLAGGGTGQETIDFSNLLGSVVVNVSSPGQVPSGTAFGKATSGGFTYDFTNFDGSAITFDGSTGGTTFFAGALGDTFSGNPLATNTLNFSDAPATSVTVYACVSGSGCVNPGQAVLGSGTRINFSNITTFVGLSGATPTSSTTRFVIDDSQAGLTFSGAGGTTTADFSPSARSVQFDFSQPSNNVTVTVGILFPLPHLVQEPDTLNNITTVFGSSNGGNTFRVGSTSESFGVNGGTNNTVDFSSIGTTNAGPSGQLVVNDSNTSALGVPAFSGTFNGVTYTFQTGSAGFTNFVSASTGNTTFVAPGQTSGASYQGEGPSNTLTFIQDLTGVIVDMTTGTAQILNGSGVSIGTDFLQITTGPLAGPVDFATIVGSGGTAPNTFYGNLTGTKFTSTSTKNTVSYVNLTGPVTVDLTSDSISGAGITDTFSFASGRPTLQGSMNGGDTFVIGTGAVTLKGGTGFSSGGDILDLTSVPAPTSGSNGVTVNLQTGQISGPTISGVMSTPCSTSPTTGEVCWASIIGTPQNNTYILNANQLASGIPDLSIAGGQGSNVLDLTNITGRATVHMPGSSVGCVIAGVSSPAATCSSVSPVTFTGVSTLIGTTSGNDYVFVGNGAENLVETGSSPTGTIDFSSSSTGVSVSLANNLGTPTGTSTNAGTTISDMFTGFTSIVGTAHNDSFTQTGAGSYTFIDPQGSNTLVLSGPALSGATVTLQAPPPAAGCLAGSSQGTVVNGSVNDFFQCMSQVSSTGSLAYLVSPGETATLNGGGNGTLQLCVAGVCPIVELPTTGVTVDIGNELTGGTGTVQGYGAGTITFSGMSTIDGTNFSDLFIAGPGNYSVNGEGGADGVTFANPDHNGAMTGSVIVNDSPTNYTIPGTSTVVNSFTASATYGTIQLVGIGSITASPTGNDTIIAGSGPAVLIGGGGNGRFVLTGGTDYLYTGTGNATLDLSQLPGVTSLDLGSTSLQSLGSSGGYLQLLGGTISTVFASPGGSQIWGGNGNLTINGGSGNDWLAAGTGNQTLIGGGGGDTLVGGVGNDTLTGGSQPVTFVPGSGNDVLTSGTSGNTLSYQGAPNPIEVNLGSTTFSVPAGEPGFGVSMAPESASGGWAPAPGDSANLASAGITNVIGTSGADILVAGTGDNIAGNGGNDLFVVNGGNSTLTAGSGTHSIFLFAAGSANGNNVINGGGNSTVDFSQTTSTVNVNLQSKQATGGFGGFQQLNGILNIVGARASHDVLIGATGGTITGLGTSDFLQSGPGGGNTLINDGSFGDTFCAQSSCASGGTVAGGGDTLIAIQSTSGNAFFTKNGAVDTIEERGPTPANTLVTDPTDKIVIV